MAVELSTPWLVGGPGLTPASDNYAALLNYHVDLLNQLTTIQFIYGSATLNGANTTAFAHDPQASPVTLTLGWKTGGPYTWFASNGTSGTMSNGDLTNLNAGMSGGFMALINALEALAFEYALFGATTGSPKAVNYPWSVNPAVG